MGGVRFCDQSGTGTATRLVFDATKEPQPGWFSEGVVKRYSHHCERRLFSSVKSKFEKLVRSVLPSHSSEVFWGTELWREPWFGWGVDGAAEVEPQSG